MVSVYITTTAEHALDDLSKETMLWQYFNTFQDGLCVECIGTIERFIVLSND